MAHVAAATVQPWLSCTDYCKCDGGVGCFSHFKRMNIEDDEGSLSASDDDDEGQQHCVYIIYVTADRLL